VQFGRVVNQVELALTSLGIRDRGGEAVLGLRVLPTLMDALTDIGLREKWDEAEGWLRDAVESGDQDLVDAAAEEYRDAATVLIEAARRQLRKKQIARDIERQAYLAREES